MMRITAVAFTVIMAVGMFAAPGAVRHAEAENFTLTATPAPGSSGLSGFEIKYYDDNGDNMLGYSNPIFGSSTPDIIIYFSGVTYTDLNGNSTYYDTLGFVPTYPPYLNGPGQFGSVDWWYFANSIQPAGLSGRNTAWMYNQVLTPVPEPCLMVLLGISMASVVGLKKWWKD